jgi:hypothetical protein
MECLGLLELSMQVADSGPVGGFGCGVQQNPSVPEIGAHRQLAFTTPRHRPRFRWRSLAVGRLKVNGVELPAWMSQQLGQIMQALGVPQAHYGTVVGDGPVISLATKQVL